jgi:hypothetical protein
MFGRARLVLTILMALTLAAGAASAQVILDAPGFVTKKADPRLPDVKPAPLAWPRLDPGAPICRTEADVARLAARRQGENPGAPADCRAVSVPTAVTILQRKGPGLTQVRVTEASQVVGWTDVWLPEKAPVRR